MCLLRQLQACVHYDTSYKYTSCAEHEGFHSFQNLAPVARLSRRLVVFCTL